MKRKIYLILLSSAIGLFTSGAHAQNPWEALEKRSGSLGLSGGLEEFRMQSLKLQLVKASQTVAALNPSIQPEFDFTPGERLSVRKADSLYHLGDVNLRVKAAGDTGWKSFSSAWNRHPVKSINANSPVLAAADLAPSLGLNCPVRIIREWVDGGDKLILRFRIKNISKKKLKLGALGFPMVFNNILHEHTLDEAHARNVFFDPYIGKDAGYLQVARLDGEGQALLVLPEGKTPFEAYRPLLDDPTPRGITFEGFHEWMVYSKAYAEEEWKGVEQWNNPTSVQLVPGEEKVYGLQLVLTDGIKDIEPALKTHKHPLAIGIPGYVLPKDVEGKLFIDDEQMVEELEVYPKGALVVHKKPSGKGGLQVYDVRGKQWGRATILIRYRDGREQSIHYKVIHPEGQVMDSIGRFLTNKQWFDKPDDLFGRNPSVISYDYELQKQVTQDSRAWVAGLSDEGGAGSWLEAIMKQLIKPDQQEIEKLQRFLHQTLWGNIQHKDGPEKYGVKKSVFYYEPDSLPPGTYDAEINFKVWSAWNKKGADDVGRSYNYPHVAAAHWVFYRLARYHQNLVDRESWDWYLKNAYETTMAMVNQAPHYAQFGQMEGTVFLRILEDLKAEDMQAEAEALEAAMRKRAEHWRSLNYPFGSEMPWDSTGQEEVYMWSDYFGFGDKAAITLKAILAYMPTLPHWAYNGNARRYWDFLYGGKIARVERQIHHYGSALNAIPVLKAYRDQPSDLHLLRVGYGGLLGGIANVTEDGFGPCAFHSYPSTLANDALSGDYGSGFLGYALNTSAYLTHHEAFGWLGFGGNVQEQSGKISFEPTTAARSEFYLAPADFHLSLKAGKIRRVQYDPESGSIEVYLDPADANTALAYFKLNEKATSTYAVEGDYQKERGMLVTDLGAQECLLRFKVEPSN